LNDMAKNLILWMIIAGVLLTVFQNINQEPREDSINYSEFIREVRAGRVQRGLSAARLALSVRAGSAESVEDVRGDLFDLCVAPGESVGPVG
jgi:cell division protease FtsH